MNSCVLSLLCLYTDEILAGIMMEGLEAVLFEMDDKYFQGNVSLKSMLKILKEDSSLEEPFSGKKHILV